MLARVRESLFAILGGVIEDASVLDLFSGTGSLGLEALSRGAARVRCFERDRRAAARLAENVEALGVGERVAIVRGDALDARRWNPSGSAGEPWADVVLCDPPYPMFQDGGGRERVIEALGRLPAPSTNTDVRESNTGGIVPGWLAEVAGSFRGSCRPASERAVDASRQTWVVSRESLGCRNLSPIYRCLIGGERMAKGGSRDSVVIPHARKDGHVPQTHTNSRRRRHLDAGGGAHPARAAAVGRPP